MPTDRTAARRLARESLDIGHATGWFEQLYEQAGGNEQIVPWADMEPNPHFLFWLARKNLSGNGKTALVVGCGLGDDAEELARRQFRVVAFDISPTAIAWCRRRFPNSSVEYVAADLLEPPENWGGAFDFVLEVYTFQVLPAALRQRVASKIAGVVARGGTLLVVARGRDACDDPGQMPWPVTREELATFADFGLREVCFEDFLDDETPPVRRFRVEYVRNMILGIHHVQLTVPKGAEAEARRFYSGVLGLREIPKPESLKGRGGIWLQVGDRQLHIGVEDNVDRRATKAHVAYEVRDLGAWKARLAAAGIQIVECVPIPGYDRLEFRDPFSNRVELIERTSSESERCS
jgi:SAM-dependent methyltransferase